MGKPSATFDLMHGDARSRAALFDVESLLAQTPVATVVVGAYHLEGLIGDGVGVHVGRIGVLCDYCYNMDVNRLFFEA